MPKSVADVLRALGAKRFTQQGRELAHPEDYEDRRMSAVMPEDQPARGRRGSQKRNPRMYRSVSQRLKHMKMKAHAQSRY